MASAPSRRPRHLHLRAPAMVCSVDCVLHASVCVSSCACCYHADPPPLLLSSRHRHSSWCMTCHYNHACAHRDGYRRHWKEGRNNKQKQQQQQHGTSAAASESAAASTCRGAKRSPECLSCACARVRVCACVCVCVRGVCCSTACRVRIRVCGCDLQLSRSDDEA